MVNVPGSYGVQQRQATIDAAEIAGIKISKLFNDSSANIMNYGIFRKGELSDDTPKLVAFVDPGYSKTSFFLGLIKKNSAEIIFEKTHSNLGVRNLDQALLKFYMDKFQ